MPQHRSRRRTRRLAVVLFCTGALLLLATGLSSLSLTVEQRDTTPPEPTAAPEERPPEQADNEAAAESLEVSTAVMLLAAFAVILGAAYIFLPDARRPLQALAIIFLLFFGSWFLYTRSEFDSAGSAPVSAAAPAAAADDAGPETPVYLRQASAEVDLLVSILIVGSLIGGGVLFWLRRRQETAEGEDALQELAHSSQEALYELRAGVPLREAVLRCYLEMSRTLRQARGLQRSAALTPREFAAQLAANGLPHGAVQRLTALFEAVRYGGAASSERERREAIACLEEVIAVADQAGERAGPAGPFGARQR